jgi:hypothetical protein
MGNAPDAVHKQVERIVSSPLFQSSVNLQRMLRYLAKQSLREDAAQLTLKEYTIGLECFGRPETYDPRTDPSVRVHAWKLRAKLREYYETAGREDPVVIELPKGSYRLHFSERAPSVSRLVRRSFVSWRPIAACLAVLCILAGWQAAGRHGDGRSARSAEFKAFWAPVLQDNAPVTVVVGSPMFIQSDGMTVRVTSMNDTRDLDHWPSIEPIAGRFSSSAAKPKYSYIGAGETAAAFRLATAFSGYRHGLVLKRSIMAGDIDSLQTHLILLGSPKTNAAMRAHLAGLDFRVHNCGVWNDRPGAGEPSFYPCSADSRGEITEAHAVLARLPARSGARSVYLLAGGSGEAMTVAAEAATNPAVLREIVRALSGRSGRLPAGFQAVLHARFESRQPVGVRVVAQRSWEANENQTNGPL